MAKSKKEDMLEGCSFMAFMVVGFIVVPLLIHFRDPVARFLNQWL